MFPCMLTSSVAALGFLLPVESGEKVSLEITVLLSLAVFLLLVSESLPPSSEDFPIIGNPRLCRTHQNIFQSSVYLIPYNSSQKTFQLSVSPGVFCSRQNTFLSSVSPCPSRLHHKTFPSSVCSSPSHPRQKTFFIIGWSESLPLTSEDFPIIGKSRSFPISSGNFPIIGKSESLPPSSEDVFYHRLVRVPPALIRILSYHR